MKNRSIMQRDSSYCYLCEKLYGKYRMTGLERHHAMHGTGGRPLAEKYGLYIWLCAEHHRTGSEAVHQNRDNDLMIQQDAQRAFEREYPDLSFLEVFGINRL